MKKTQKITAIILSLAMVIGLFTSCGKSPEEAIIGKWVLTDYQGEYNYTTDGSYYITFYEGGNIKENCHIFYDSYGISYKIQNDKIIFIYYGSVANEANFKLKGDTLKLEIKENIFTFTRTDE